MNGFAFQAAGCNSLGIAWGGAVQSEIEPMNPPPPPSVPPPPNLPPPPPFPPTGPPPPIHPDGIVPFARIKMLDADVQFHGSASTLVLAAPFHPDEVESDRFGGPTGFTVRTPSSHSHPILSHLLLSSPPLISSCPLLLSSLPFLSSFHLRLSSPPLSHLLFFPLPLSVRSVGATRGLRPRHRRPLRIWVPQR